MHLQSLLALSEITCHLTILISFYHLIPSSANSSISSKSRFKNIYSKKRAEYYVFGKIIFNWFLSSARTFVEASIEFIPIYLQKNRQEFMSETLLPLDFNSLRIRGKKIHKNYPVDTSGIGIEGRDNHPLPHHRTCGSASDGSLGQHPQRYFTSLQSPMLGVH